MTSAVDGGCFLFIEFKYIERIEDEYHETDRNSEYNRQSWKEN